MIHGRWKRIVGPFTKKVWTIYVYRQSLPIRDYSSIRKTCAALFSVPFISAWYCSQVKAMGYESVHSWYQAKVILSRRKYHPARFPADYEVPKIDSFVLYVPEGHDQYLSFPYRRINLLMWLIGAFFNKYSC